MGAIVLAEQLFARAVRDEQTAHRVEPTDDVAAVRAEVRRLAREAGVHIRTGLLDDVLVVARADAALWHDSTAVMREKLTP